jgi:hypothetical protein
MVTLAHALGAGRAGARHQAQLETAAGDQALQPRTCTVGELALARAAGEQARFRGVKAHGPLAALVRPERIPASRPGGQAAKDCGSGR